MRMKFKYSILLSAFAVLFLSSCKKDVIEIPASNDPVFRVDGAMSGGAFSLIAGDDNAYMHTMTSVENGVNVFSGRLSNDEFSIEIGVYDGLLDYISHEALGQIVSDNTPDFAHSSGQPIAELNAELLDDLQNVSQVNWYVNSELAGIDFAYIYEPGIYNVCAKVTFNDNSTIEYCNELIIGYERSANCNIQSNVNVAGDLIASIQGATSNITDIKWFLDNYPIGTDIYLNLPVSAQLHRLKAEITFANGVKRIKESIIDGSIANRDLSDFTIFETNQVQLPSRDFNVKVSIVRNGKFYNSLPADNGASTIQITGIEYYGENTAGNRVYKVSADISAMVQESSSFKETAINLSTTFGIEIP